MVRESGDVNSKHIILIDEPAFEDIRNGYLFSGKVGAAIANELGKVGIQATQLRIISFHPHIRSKECSEDWTDATLKKIHGASTILMCGSITTSIFTDLALSQCSGIVVRSKLLKGTKIVPAPAAGSILSQGLGEFRLAFETYADVKRRAHAK